MTDALPPDAWLDADTDLQLRLDALDRDARAAHAVLRDAVRADAAEPLRALTAEAAAVHRRTMEVYGFDRPLDAPPRPPEVLWDALTAYRREMTDAHTAFRDGLEALDLGATLGGRYTKMLASLATLADDQPAVVLRPEPEGLVAAEAGDSVALLGRKLTERTRRRSRELGRSVTNGLRGVVRKAPRPAEPVAQSVPLRALVEEQVSVRLPHAFAAEHQRVQAEFGRAVARLEDAFATWANELLRLESKLDRPRFHATDALAWAAPAPADPDAAPDGAPAPPPPVPIAEVRRVREVAQALDAALHGFALAPSLDDEDTLAPARDALVERVRRSGYDSDRVAAPGDGEPLAEIRSDVERWADWHRMVVRRMGVDRLLLYLRERLVEEVERLIDGVTDAVVLPVIETVEAAAGVFGTLRAEATEVCDRIDDPAALADALRGVLDTALHHVDRAMLPALQTLSLDRAVEEALAAMRGRLNEAVAALPERVTLYASLGPDRAGHAGRTAEVELQRIVRTTLSEEFVAYLLKSADALRQPLFKAISGAEGIRDVVRYNIETAIEELEAVASHPATETAARSDDEGEDAFANARELTVDGLARAEERLHSITAPLGEPWQAFIRRATETFENGWTTLHGRANAANLVEAQFLDFKTRTQQTFTRAQRQTRETGERTALALRKWLRFGRVGAKRLVQIGQAAAGLAAQTEADRQRTLDALAEAARLHAGLPLVYRRLFSFAPLTDATLFEDRADQLARAAEHAKRWREDRDSSALIVTAEPGSGRTSFLNLLRATTFADDETVHLDLTDRTADEATLARLIGETLGVDGAASFEALEAHLLAPEHVGRKRVCLIEGLEHLLLRAPGGLDLVERTFIFMSRTDAPVLWVGTMVLPGWRFVERTAPQITGLVDAVVLPPFTRAQVEAALMKRHARSGLPLTFAEPAEPSPLLARRLSKATSPEARQEILHGEFFDGLYRASGPNMMLALLYWLRAADFEVTADTLTLRPVRPLDFAFVGAFDLPRSFALKALLQHGTLTLSEHDRIFRTTRDESFLIFESLHNLRLIQPTDGTEAGLPARRNGVPGVSQPVQEGVRYRLHPLAVAPVTDALRAKNML
ncbi:MAG: hypothetical protein ABJF88_12875 [Rhodothermales bacterium]